MPVEPTMTEAIAQLNMRYPDASIVITDEYRFSSRTGDRMRSTIIWINDQVMLGDNLADALAAPLQSGV